MAFYSKQLEKNFTKFYKRIVDYVVIVILNKLEFNPFLIFSYYIKHIKRFKYFTKLNKIITFLFL